MVLASDAPAPEEPPYCPFGGPDASGFCCADNETLVGDICVLTVTGQRPPGHAAPPPGYNGGGTGDDAGGEDNGGGGGGGGSCAGSGGCASTNNEPTIKDADRHTDAIKNCMARTGPGREFLSSIRNATITFEYEPITGSHRLGNTDGSNGTYTIYVDKAEIERDARSANWSYRQLLAEVVIHELMHVAYDMDPRKNPPEPHTQDDQLYQDAWELYKDIFRVNPPQNGYRAFHRGRLPRCLQD